MNTMTVRIFDINRSHIVTTHFYHMCVTSGRDASKSAQLFQVVQSKMQEDKIPWSQAASLSVDNTNSIIGKHNSFASRCKAQNNEIYVLGCPCHLAHIAKMGMRLDEYEDRVTKGVVSQLGSCIEETDIEQILTQLKTYRRSGKFCR